MTRQLLPLRWPTVAALLVLLTISPRAQAIDINLNFDTAANQFPSYDPDGSKLEAIAFAARNIWKDLLPYNDHVYSVSVHYNQFGAGSTQLGVYNDFDHTITIRNNNAWFLDPTPSTNEEFQSFDSTYFKNLPAVEANAFAGSPPGFLETGFTANAIAGGDANGVDDMLSVLVHEMGHFTEIGYNLLAPSVPLQPQFLGNRGGISVNREDESHIVPDNALMDPFLMQSQRVLPSALDVIVAAHEQGHDQIRLRRMDWFSDAALPGLNLWSWPTNWEGGSEPTSTADVQIRNGDDVQVVGSTAVARNLAVHENSSIFLLSEMHVNKDLTIGSDYDDATHVDVLDGVLLNVDGKTNLNSGRINLIGGDAWLESLDIDYNNAGELLPSVIGHGTVLIGDKLVNHGRIRAEDGTLSLDGAAGVSLDLDGNNESIESARGRVVAKTGDVNVNRPLADEFNGTAAAYPGQAIRFTGQWDFGQNGLLWFLESGAQSEFYSPFVGDSVSFNRAHISLDEGTDARIRATSIKFLAGGGGTSVFVPTSADLALQGNILYEQGDFDGAGTIRQNGTATVAGNVAMNVDHYDWDGNLATPTNTLVDDGNKFTINAKSFGDGSAVYAGHTTLATGATLEVNFTGGFGVWRLDTDGVLRMEKNGHVSGSPIIVQGQIQAVAGTNHLDAPTTLSAASIVTISDKATLNINKPTTYGGGIITTDGGQPNDSMLQQFDTATVLGHHRVTVGFFDWDASDITKSNTVIQPDGFLDIVANEIGNGVTNPFLILFDRFGFGDDVTINSGMLGVQVGGSARDQEFVNYWTINKPGRMLLNNTDHSLPTVRGSKLINHGLISGNGQFLNPLENDGEIALGHEDAAGRILAMNSFSQTAEGLLDVDLGGLVPGTTFDQLYLDDGGVLDGALAVHLLPGFVPSVGNVFRIIEANIGTTITGTFASVQLPPGQWDVIYAPLFVDLRFTAVPEPSTLVIGAIGMITLGWTLRRRGQCAMPKAA